jgi:PhoH-like ATPase
MTRGKRIYALDTNVLMHDPTALFRFEEHDVFLPMTVLEELDAAKKGTSETARNARQVSRFINELIENGNGRHIEDGVELRHPQGLQLDRRARGRLYFQTSALAPPVGKSGKRGIPDNNILAAIVALRETRKEPIALVSKDINLRIKATIYGIAAEEY